MGATPRAALYAGSRDTKWRFDIQWRFSNPSRRLRRLRARWRVTSSRAAFAELADLLKFLLIQQPEDTERMLLR
jgi:hypothetical protein